jgi:hypothetical protein
MPEQLDQASLRVDQPSPASALTADDATLADRLVNTPGLATLVDEAEATWRARAAAQAAEGSRASAPAEGALSDGGRPGWRTFEDAFPTFYEFTNRPR